MLKDDRSLKIYRKSPRKKEKAMTAPCHFLSTGRETDNLRASTSANRSKANGQFLATGLGTERAGIGKETQVQSLVLMFGECSAGKVGAAKSRKKKGRSASMKHSIANKKSRRRGEEG